MVYDVASLPDDPDQLKSIIITLSQANARQQETLDQQKKTLDQLVAEVSKLNVTIEHLLEMIFGKKSEKQSKGKSNDESKNDLASPETSENADSNEGRKKRKKNGGGGRTELPKHLERVENVIDVPEEERICPCCGKPFKCIGDERSEQLHFRPIEFYVVVQVLMKYIAACHCSEKRSVTAESPIKTIDKGVASTSVVAAIAVMKYADHLPLARQATQVFKRSGVTLAQSSMCRWMRIAADMLEPLYDLICELILLSYCLGIDATNVKYREPGVQGKCKTGFVWGAVGDENYPYNAYFFRRDGTRAGLESIVKNYSNILRCDAHSIYDAIFEPENPKPGSTAPTEQGCWSHGRRYFHKARKVHPDAQHVLTLIGSLYGVERRAKKLTPDVRLAMRQQESLPVLDQVFDWCRENKEKYLPKEPLFLAIQYLLNHEAALRVYCTDGRLAIDNNETERMLRLAAIGRKNWMFFGSERGGKTGCILYTILGSARRHGLNEFEYLFDILERLGDLPSEAEILNMLPDRWKKRTK
jgi:Transposase and inactivated derivatives